MDRKKHFKVHAEEFNHQSEYFSAIKQASEEDESNWKPCITCKRLVGYTNENEICLQCLSTNVKEDVVVSNLRKEEVKSFDEQLEKINCTYIKLHIRYPRKYRSGFLVDTQLLPSKRT